jgi:hypothetical protein
VQALVKEKHPRLENRYIGQQYRPRRVEIRPHFNHLRMRFGKRIGHEGRAAFGKVERGALSDFDWDAVYSVEPKVLELNVLPSGAALRRWRGLE